MGAHEAKCSYQMVTDCVFGNTEFLGYFFIAMVLKAAEPEHLRLLGRQKANDFLNIVVELAKRCLSFGGWGVIADGMFIQQIDVEMRPAAPDDRDDAIAACDIYICFNILYGCKIPPFFPDHSKSILHYVHGQLGRLSSGKGSGVYTVPVTIIQNPECRFIACRKAFEQILFVMQKNIFQYAASVSGCKHRIFLEKEDGWAGCSDCR